MKKEKPPLLVSIALVIALTLLTGFADSQGFVHASRIWQDDQLVWAELALSGLAFLVGIVSYYFVLRFMIQVGIVSAEMQSLGWFSVTIIGVALLSGEAFRWHTIDKIVAFFVVMGIAWLMFHTGE